MGEHVCIRGAGIVGIWVAIFLASKGAHVELHDPGGFPSRQSASWSAAGLLTPGSKESKTPAMYQLGQQALEIWRRYNFMHENGSYLLADDLDESSLSYYTEVCGYEVVRPTSELDFFTRGAADRTVFLVKDDCHLDPRATLNALAEVAENLGVRYIPKSEFRAGSWDINCTGVGAQRELTSLYGLPGALCIVGLDGAQRSRPLRRIAGDFPAYAVPWDDGRMAVGAINVPQALDQIRLLDMRSTMRKISTASVNIDAIEFSSGIRPFFPDKEPKILCRAPRKIYVNGVYKDGFLLAPILGQIVAEFIEGKNHFLVQRI
jgi:glycine oxidase